MSEMNLRVHDADPERVERIRLRCVSVLEARRREAETRRARGPAPRGWLEPAIVVSMGAIYLVDAFASALALFR
jgi:hypothetical protein